MTSNTSMALPAEFVHLVPNRDHQDTPVGQDVSLALEVFVTGGHPHRNGERDHILGFSSALAEPHE